jgi:hypothetical protein
LQRVILLRVGEGSGSTRTADLIRRCPGLEVRVQAALRVYTGL